MNCFGSHRTDLSVPPLRRPTPLLIALALACFGGALHREASAEPTTTERPPNIVFFFIDDQTSSVLGCYGNSLAQTPNIDRLAAQGTRFDRAYVSQAICWVSRTTVLTGLTGRSYGTPGNRELARPETVESLWSDLLRDHGYRTGFFGKWHAKMPKGYQPHDHFDVFESIQRNPYFKPQADGSLRHETDLIVDRGIEFLQQQPSDQPFALNLWFNACHAEDGDRRPGIGHFPWPQSQDGLFDDVQMPLPKLSSPTIFDGLPDFLKVSITRQRYFWRWNTEEKYQANMQAYYRMVSGIDAAIGRLLERLEEAGLRDNTIIVYMADNGYLMGNRGLAGKWSHFEESIKVPLIIHDPRVEEAARGQTTEALALNLDLPSTFADWAGVTIPAHYQGRSLRALVAGQPPQDWRLETFHEHFAVRSRIPAFEGVRDARFKYVRYIDHDNYEFLHDLERDPDELVNLASLPEHADTLAAMRLRTDNLVQQYGGPLEPLDGRFQASVDADPEAAATVTMRPSPDGWVRLFDGKSMNQWTGDRAFWSVRDGAITGKTDGSLDRNRFLSWKVATVRNFELEMEVKITAGGNSGIQYRSEMRPDIGLDSMSGYQCDVVPNNPRYNGMLYEERGRRILAHTGQRVVMDPTGDAWVVETFDVPPAPAGQWHRFRVLVRGNHHQHWINDQKTVDFIDLDPRGRSLEGCLGMQVHVGPPMEVQFRGIRIRHLPDDLPLVTAEEAPIPASAVGVRPQGKLPADWKPPVYGER